MSLASFYKMMGKREILAMGSRMSYGMAHMSAASSLTRAARAFGPGVTNSRFTGAALARAAAGRDFRLAGRAASHWLTAPGAGWATRGVRWGSLAGGVYLGDRSYQHLRGR